MKKTAILAALLTFLPVCMNVTSTKIVHASEQVAIIKSVGEALALGDKAKDNALNNAKQKAVKKAVARFIAPSEDPGSLYQKIVNNYANYVRGEVKVIKAQKINGKLALFCDVPVDFGDIQSGLSQEVTKYQNQEKHLADSVIFLVRVNGLPQVNTGESKIPIMVLTDYGMAFGNYGFSSYGSDISGNAYQMMADTAKSITGVTYLDYRNEAIKNLLGNVSVTYAVVGEISIKNLSSNATGEYAEAECITEVIKPNATSTGVEVIGQFNDSYNVSARNQQEALAIVCKKATVNSAKYLADITYQYWKNHK